MTQTLPTSQASYRSDGDLLTEFLEHRRQEAFEEMVRRHGGMVMSVCNAVLHNGSDAEDAAQAVFITLAKRASGLRGRATAAGWLHKVAWYIATRARKAAAIRSLHEREAAAIKEKTMTEPQNISTELLHAALERLPERYRLPLLLHHIEGRSQQETAELLGCTASAASVRLTRGREMLRKRLQGRGTSAGAAAVTAGIAYPASAGVSPGFVSSVSQAAISAAAGKAITASVSSVALSKGAMNMLFWAKVKFISAMVAIGVIVSGAGVATIIAAGENKEAATGAASKAVEEPTVFMWQLVHAKVADGQLTLVPAQEEPVNIGNLGTTPAAAGGVHMNVPGNVYVRTGTVMTSAGRSAEGLNVIRSLREGKKSLSQAADLQKTPSNLQGPQLRLTQGLMDMETKATERVTYVDVFTPGPARVTLTVTKTDKEVPGVKSVVTTVVKLEAASFGELCATHPEEAAKYIEPILRDLDLGGVFFVDLEDARHAWAAQLPQDPAVAAKLKALLPKLDDDSPEVRAAAELELKALGDAGVAAVKGIDLSKQPFQTALTLQDFLEKMGAKTEDARLSSSDFLLLCMALEDKQIADLAKARLEKLRGKAVEVDLTTPAEERSKAVRKMLMEGWANAKGAETRK